MTQRRRSDYPMHLNDLLGLFPWIPAGPVCDIGCGDGHLSAAAAAYGLPTLALDVSESCIHNASRVYGSGVEWLHSDIRSFRLQRESYAALFCLDVFPFIPNGERARIMGRLKAAIKPGGLLILSGLMHSDPAARQKWARGSNRISQLTTGVFEQDELLERFEDWEILFYFEGPQQREFEGQKRLFEMAQIVVRKPLSPIESTNAESFPMLGLGLSWGAQAVEQFKQERALQHLEILVEHYFAPHQDSLLAHLCRQTAVIPRAQHLSLGSAQAPETTYVEALSRVLQRTGAAWWTAPLSFAHNEYLRVGAQLPLPMTEEALERSKHNIRCLHQHLALPLSIENTWIPPALAQAELDPFSFLRHVAEEADCSISLNVEILFRQARHMGLSPEQALHKLPLQRVIQLRLGDALCQAEEQIERVQSFLKQILKECPLRAVTLESPVSVEPLQSIFKELSWL